MTPDPARYQVRTMDRDELEFALELAAREGWNPGLGDAECFYQADPHGFFVGLLDGKPIGCISAVSYGEFGFIGLYIVLPEERGKGYGLPLWRHAMAYLEGRNVGLDGVVEQQSNYRRSGFTLAHRNLRYEGNATGRPPAGGPLVELREIPLEELTAYDRRVFPAPRERFLRSWSRIPGGKGLAWIEEGRMLGYGVIRPCRVGWKIGPLFADTPAVADALFGSISAHAGAGDPIALDVPETNPSAVFLAERHGMRRGFETARMYTGPAPDLAMERVYGITTFELG